MRDSALITLLFVFALSVVGCKKYDPVPESECKKVVTHARKVMGKHADKRSKMMKDCKAASDQERGCAKVAKSPAALLRCTT